MANSDVTDADILAQIPPARDREDAERREGLRATEARFDERSRRIVLELTNGYSFAFPARVIRALRGASKSQLSEVELDPSGAVLQWEALDVDLSVPGLLLSAVGDADRRSYLAKLAGKTTSPAKAEAARRNGLKGGRPRLRFGVEKADTPQKGKRYLVAAKKGHVLVGAGSKKSKDGPTRRSKG